MKAKKLILFALIILSVALILTGCKAAGNPKVQVEMENGDTFVIELYPEYAPKTVDNFVKLVNDGFYDGLTFHRIVDNFMAQGGGFTPPGINGEKKESAAITGEFANNGYTANTLKHTKGVISMARTNDMNSASSEFFIMLGTSAFLDGNYAAFGKVIEGMEVIDKLQEVERTMGFAVDDTPSIPVEPVIIKKMTVIK